MNGLIMSCEWGGHVARANDVAWSGRSGGGLTINESSQVLREAHNTEEAMASQTS